MVASDGRVPGVRGRQTRRALLDSTSRLLRETSYRDLTVVQIAKDAGASAATFYQYFPDVEQAILYLAEEVVEDVTRLTEPLSPESWDPDAPLEASEELTRRFLEFWKEHEALLKVVNLAIVEGDRRFRRVRNRLLEPVARELRARLGETRDDPWVAADAAALVSMLVHVAEHRPRSRDWDVRLPDLRASLSRIVAAGVTGYAPPGAVQP